jgi:hypothetical protein
VDARNALDFALGGKAFVEAFDLEGLLLVSPYAQTIFPR